MKVTKPCTHKSEVMIWCDGVATTGSTVTSKNKRPSPATNEEDLAPRKKNSRSESISKRLKEVACAYDKLESQHRGSFSKEQLHMWAHLIQMEKWSSYEIHPISLFSKQNCY